MSSVIVSSPWIAVVILCLFVSHTSAQGAYWRVDWKCGPGNRAPNGQDAKCQANCCSKSGWCGDSYAHCVGSLYKDYRCCMGEQCEQSCEILLSGKSASQSSNYMYTIHDWGGLLGLRPRPPPLPDLGQTSQLVAAGAERAIDGNIDGDWNSHTCTHTQKDQGAWWMVNLSSSYCVGSVVIYNRQDCCKERLQGAVVRIGDDPNRNNPSCKVSVTRDYINKPGAIPITCNLEGRYISISLPGAEFLTLCEVQAFQGICRSEINLVGKSASQSSILQDSTIGDQAVASRAIDGLISGHLEDHSCAQTNTDPGAWWMVDMEESQCIGTVIIHDTQSCCHGHLQGAVIRVGNDSSRNNPSCESPIDLGQNYGKAHSIIEVSCNLNGRYISITLPDTEYLTLCEVRALPGECTSEISLLGMAANQSSTRVDHSGVPTSAESAIDGNASSSCSYTKHDQGAWWMVDLENPQCIGSVVIHNRQDCCQERLQGAVVRVGNDSSRHNPQCTSAITAAQIEANNMITVACNLMGRYISVTLPGMEALTLCEVVAHRGDCKQGEFCEANIEFDDKYGWLDWPRTKPGTTYFSDTTCANNTSKAGQPVAYRYCGLSTELPNQYVGIWGPTEHLDCEYSAQTSQQGEGGQNKSDCAQSVQASTPQTPNAVSGACPTNVTGMVDGSLTWPQTTAGELAYSEERCSNKTIKAGWPVAVRYCKPSPGLTSQAQWDSVQILSCSDDDLDTEGDFCPPDWSSHGLYCYFVNVDDHVSFSGAVSACQNMSSNLTSIHSIEEQFYHMMVYKKTSTNLWIGLHDRNNEHRFEWIDGSPLDFQSWIAGQPDDWSVVGGEDCVHLSTSGNWNDRTCDGPLGYICKQPKVVRNGYCPGEETHSSKGGTLTWQDTLIGNAAFSEETCGSNTENSGRPVAVRYCKPSFDACIDETEDVPIGTNLSAQCPENWMSYSGYCYYISNESRNFVDAQADCTGKSATLASIHDVGEQVFIQGLRNGWSTGVYIGLHDVSTEDIFKWVDGTPYDYSNWSEHEPNNNGSGEDCVVLFGDDRQHLKGWWNDIPCTHRKNYVCKKRGICEFPLGMENGDISNSQITASSEWDPFHGPARARLNQQRNGALRGAWTAASNAHNQDQWIQVDFLRKTVVTAVVTQGRADEDQWVKQYKVEYTTDGSTWSYITDIDGVRPKVFDGNTDQSTPVTRQLPHLVTVIAIRIRPTMWNRHMSMRFELLGCIDNGNACRGTSRFGWSTSTRGTIMDGNDWTLVIPGKEIPCDGVITHWHYWARRSVPFRAIVWRRVSDLGNRFVVVGVNDIPAAAVNQKVDYTVPKGQRFQTKKGDLLGFAFTTSVLAYQSASAADSTLVRWYKNTNPYDMTAGEVFTFADSGNRAYSLQATIDASEILVQCKGIKGEWGKIDLIPCNDELHLHSSGSPCPAGVTNNTEYGLISWPDTPIGTSVMADVICGNTTTKNGQPVAFRSCGAGSNPLSDIPVGEWGESVYLGCDDDSASSCPGPQGTSSPTIAPCQTITTPSYGRRRLQNTDFIFLDSSIIADGATHISIGIQGSVDAYVLLSPTNNPADDTISDTGIPKLVIGGWNNQYIGIICNSNQDRNADIRTRYSTPGVLSSSEMRYFTISWANNQIQVTRMGSSSPLLTHSLECPVTVRYIGVCTGWSVIVKWTTCIPETADYDYCLPGVTMHVDGPLNWVKTLAGQSTFSVETCPGNTPKAGWPIAVRYCQPSAQLVQWDSVKLLGCMSDEVLEYEDAGYCPPDWRSHGGFCYYVNTEDRKNFSAAGASCQRLGGNLTSIHSSEQQLFHSILVREAGEDLWIGLHDVTNKGDFGWTDGTPLIFTSWSSGQPDDWSVVGGEDCGHLYTNGQWNDRACSKSLGFICKQQRVVKEGFCPPDVTYSANGILTWQKTTVGETAFSDETCGANTDNSGRSIGARFCGHVFEECTSDVTDSVFRECPRDWKGFDEFCYYLNSETKTLEEAEAACQELNANLVSIHNAGEQGFIQDLTKEVERGIVIGLHDQINERTFTWVDNTPVDYKNWAGGEPNNGGGNEDCVQLIAVPSKKGWWNDIPCTVRKQFVCKKTGLCASALGMENGRIKDGQITASSSSDQYHGPTRSRLNQPEEGLLKGAWTAASSAANRDQWIQVDFEKVTTITAVILQGRADEDQWVRKYKVEYTHDGSNWQYTTDGSRQAKVFEGNSDRSTPVTDQLPQAVKVMAIRIRPTEWHNYISMRFELLGCEDKHDTCLGSSRFGWTSANRRTEDGNDWTFVVPGKEIPCDGVITHWQYWAKYTRPFRAIVWKKVEGHQSAFDIVGINDIPPADRANQVVDYVVPPNERFQVHRGDLLGFAFTRSLITYTTRGSDIVPVRWYKNSNPDDLSPGTRATFTGSGNRAYSLSATVDLAELLETDNQCTSGKGKWNPPELIPCNNKVEEYLPVMCRDPLGMEDETIKNDQITASSSYDHNHDPSRARLNYLSGDGGASSWSARFNDREQWIQVNLLHRQTVSGVVLQGRDSNTFYQYVMKFKVQYGQDGIKWNYVKDANNIAEVFDGNTDRLTPVTQYFHTPISTRFVRIRPWEWNEHISLRFELLGCQDCPLGWDVNGNHCYYINTEQVTFSDAQSECERMGSNLTSIHNDDEQLYHAIQAKKANEYLWIGLHDRTDERRFFWIDGSPTDDFEAQWAPYQPDNWGQDGEDCAHLRTGKDAGLWNDLPCTGSAGYMCKKAKKRRDGMCPAILTSTGNDRQAYLTWENVLAGEIGFSDEVCPDESLNGGSPLATRFCRPTSEWGNIQMLNCYDGIESTTVAPATIKSDCQTYQTPNDFDVNNPSQFDHHYYWPQIPSDVTYFTFKVRANNDVRIGLSSEYRDVQNMYGIVLGGWANTKSRIRPCKDCRGEGPFPAISTPSILSPDEHRHFFVSFDNGNIRVGRVGEDPLVTYQSDVNYEIRYVGIGTGRGSTGDWIFCGFASAIVDCPVDWEMHGDYCYSVVMDSVSFSQAENECENKGAQLTSIQNEQEQLYHTSLAERAGIHLWLGLHDKRDENNFVWVDGSPYGTYQNWAPGQPDNSGGLLGEDCIHMRTGNDAGLWNDLPCSSSAGYICKQPKIPTCAPEQTNSDYGILKWSKTGVGEATFSVEVCPDGTEHSGSPIAFRRCTQDYLAASHVAQGVWLPAKILGCHKDDDNSTVPKLTDSDVEAVSRKLKHFTNDIGVASAKDVHAVSWMVQNIANVESPSTKVLGSMVHAISTLMESADPSLRTGYETDMSASTSDIVRALEKQVDQTVEQQEQIEVLESSLVVVAAKVSSNETSSLRFSTYQTALDDGKSKFSDASLMNMDVHNDLQDDDSTAAVSFELPSGPLTLDTEDTNVTVSFIAYSDDFLFRSKRLESEALMVDGPIVSTTLVASNLAEPVIIKVKGRSELNSVQSNNVLPGNEPPTNSARRCVFWDFQMEDGISDWSEHGCRLIETIKGVTTCHCNHLSTFAVLRDSSNLVTSQQINATPGLVMSAGTKLAIAVTLIAVGVTLFVFLGCRKIRQSKNYHAICNFCGAVFILYLIFAAGIDATDRSTGCVLVAALLYYFTLVSLFWLVVEIRFTYSDCQAPPSATSTHVQPRSLIKAYIVSWGIPVVAIAVTMGISFDDYKNPKYCAVAVGPALFYGAVIPLTIFVLHNVVTFACALYALRRRRGMGDMDTVDHLKVDRSSRRLQAALLVSVVFSISLCLVYLYLNDPLHATSRVLFGMSVVAVGFAVCVMFCFYLDDVRDVILPKRCCMQSSDVQAHSFRNDAYEPEDENDRALSETIEIAGVTATSDKL